MMIYEAKVAISSQEKEEERVLDRIKRRAEWEYLRAKDPSYSLPHVKEVVEHIKALAQEEGLKVFFCEVTGWLHGLDWELAEQIMLPYEEQIPEEMRESILEAIELHRVPVLPPVPEKTSKLSEILQDAYRGARMGEARQICENVLLETLKSDPEKREAVIKHFNFIMEQYSGVTRKHGGWKVKPMNTSAGRRWFRSDYLAIRDYQRELLAL